MDLKQETNNVKSIPEVNHLKPKAKRKEERQETKDLTRNKAKGDKRAIDINLLNVDTLRDESIKTQSSKHEEAI